MENTREAASVTAKYSPELAVAGMVKECLKYWGLLVVGAVALRQAQGLRAGEAERDLVATAIRPVRETQATLQIARTVIRVRFWERILMEIRIWGISPE